MYLVEISAKLLGIFNEAFVMSVFSPLVDCYVVILYLVLHLPQLVS